MGTFCILWYIGFGDVRGTIAAFSEAPDGPGEHYDELARIYPRVLFAMGHRGHRQLFSDQPRWRVRSERLSGRFPVFDCVAGCRGYLVLGQWLSQIDCLHDPAKRAALTSFEKLVYPVYSAYFDHQATLGSLNKRYDSPI